MRYEILPGLEAKPIGRARDAGMMGFASLNPSYDAVTYSFFVASSVVALSPHTGASAPSPQLRGR
jgi:hypothetical protein